jgi:hypothetical protein
MDTLRKETSEYNKLFEEGRYKPFVYLLISELLDHGFLQLSADSSEPEAKAESIL